MGKRKVMSAGASGDDIFAAIRQRRVDDVRRMLREGLHPNVTDAEGEPALTLAVREEALPIVQALVEGGADVNQRGSEFRHLPIGYALGDNAGEVLAYLVRSGADINACDAYGVPVVLNAVRGGKVEAARYLIQAGAKLFDQHGRGLGDYLNERLPNYERMRQMLHELDIPFEDNSAQTVTRRALAAARPSASTQRGRFEEAAQSAEYQRMVRAMAQWYQAAAEPLDRIAQRPELLGGWSFATTVAQIDKWLVMRHRMGLTPKIGFFHFRHVRHHGIDGRLDRVAILPTADKYAVLEAIGTSGANCGLSNADVVAWLRALEQHAPFILPGVGTDFLELEFEQPLRDAKQWASRIYEFCPDAVDQGIGSVARLEKHLQRNKGLSLWWD